MSRGAFILFEGVDRCGKTTQARRLVERLNASGRAAVFMNFPDRTTAVGKQLNAYLTSAEELDDHAVHLLFSANRWEKRCGRRAAALSLSLSLSRAPRAARSPLSHRAARRSCGRCARARTS